MYIRVYGLEYDTSSFRSVIMEVYDQPMTHGSNLLAWLRRVDVLMVDSGEWLTMLG